MIRMIILGVILVILVIRVIILVILVVIPVVILVSDGHPGASVPIPLFEPDPNLRSKITMIFNTISKHRSSYRNCC